MGGGEGDGYPGRRARSAVALAALLAICAGCALPSAKEPAMSAARLRAEARGERIALVNPLELPPEALAEAEEAVRGLTHADSRLQLLAKHLEARGYLHVESMPGRSPTAREAFETRRGDCMAYALLLTAMARHVGVPVYFVHVTEVHDYYEHGGHFFVSSHVAVGQGSGPNATVVDMTRQIADWRLAVYDGIDDGAALALYYNNAAVDLMLSGTPAEAERLLAFLLEREPGIVELYTNLAVARSRLGRPAEALPVLDAGIARFPDYEPLYTNAIIASRAVGREDLAASYAERGRRISHSDPYFLFARGVALFDQAHYALAARQLERAVDAKPDSPVILAWLARSYMEAGRRRDGVETFARARRLAPQQRFLDQLEKQYPELRVAAP
jgi:tetratricopeptide (TPR) repeat protein